MEDEEKVVTLNWKLAKKKYKTFRADFDAVNDIVDGIAHLGERFGLLKDIIGIKKKKGRSIDVQDGKSEESV